MSLDKKKAALGTTQRATPRGGLIATYADFSAPLEDEESCIRYFCAGCGFLGELNEETASAVLGVGGAIWTGNYIECDSCSVCSDTEFKNARLAKMAREEES